MTICFCVLFVAAVGYGTERVCANDDNLLAAIALVESGNDANSVGDCGAAVGMYQIHKIFVDDTNRILRRKEFSYNDRYSPVRSRQMIKIYWNHYATVKRLGRKPTRQDKARIHNGGPNGYKKQSTLKYWRKVKGAL